MTSVRKLLRVFDPAVAHDEGAASSHPGVKDKATARKEIEELAPRLTELQERLYAEGKSGGTRRLVLVLQAIDAGGKDGSVKHVVGQVNPAGVRITSFVAPTAQERRHDFLWRINHALPPNGYLGVFNRSHYEDVLVVRVHDLVPKDKWEKRYDAINDWEAALAGSGTTFVKVFLHISKQEQKARLLARLDDPTKHWKVNPGDLDERELWPAYCDAYQAVLARCSTDVNPWYVVPADRKWYRDWALTHLLVEQLAELDPQWPVRPELDLDGMRRRLKLS